MRLSVRALAKGTGPIVQTTVWQGEDNVLVAEVSSRLELLYWRASRACAMRVAAEVEDALAARGAHTVRTATWAVNVSPEEWGQPSQVRILGLLADEIADAREVLEAAVLEVLP